MKQDWIDRHTRAVNAAPLITKRKLVQYLIMLVGLILVIAFIISIVVLDFLDPCRPGLPDNSFRPICITLGR
jgi:hypothetical protein